MVRKFTCTWLQEFETVMKWGGNKITHNREETSGWNETGTVEMNIFYQVVIHRKPYRLHIFNVPPTNTDVVKITQILLHIYIYIYIYSHIFRMLFQILYGLIKNKIGTCRREHISSYSSAFTPTLVVCNLRLTNPVSVEPEQHVWRKR
jgi:hypothetical protein